MSISHLRLDRESILLELKSYLKTKYQLSDREVKKYLREEEFKPAQEHKTTEIIAPVTIFNEILSPLEAIVKYLKEVKTMKLVDIAKLTARDQRAIGVTYKAASKKMPEQYKIEKTKYNLIVNILKDKNLSVAEHIVKNLKETYELNYHEVALLLKRDERTIRTLYNRAMKKNKK